MPYVSMKKRRAQGRSSRSWSPVGSLLPELWLEVIASLSIEDLCALSKCSNPIRNLTISRLFKTFVVRPFDGDPPGFVRQTLNSIGVARRRRPEDCLDVLARPYIAQAIETFLILPNNILSIEMTSLIDGIFGVLPKLPNLKTVVCSHCILFERRVNVLLQLPLKRLELLKCSLPRDLDGLTTPSGTLQSVKLVFYPQHSPTDPECDKAQIALFASLFKSPNLHSIRSINPNEVLKSISLTSPTSLTKLQLPIDATFSPYFVSALSLCRSLRIISFSCRPGGRRHPEILPFPPNTFPHLEYYAGPVDYVPNFAQGQASMKGMHIINTTFTPIPANSIRILPKSLTSLKFTSHIIGSIFLPTIHSHFEFGSLTSLTIISKGLGSRDLYEDEDLVMLPSVLHFKASVFVGFWNDKEVMSRFEEYVLLLQRVYPDLEDATFVPPLMDEGQTAVVWKRWDGGGDGTGSIRMVEMEGIGGDSDD